MIAAFFDIDGTLYRNSLMIAHFKKLVKYEILDPLSWHSDVKTAYTNWRRRTGEFEDYLQILIQIYIDTLKGKNKLELDFISKQVIDLQGDIVYRFTRDSIEHHKSKGHKVIFISGGPDFLVSRMANKYGIEDHIGSIYETDEKGNFTGNVVPMWDQTSKNKAIEGFLQRFSIDLSKSYAYGDTNGDLSMLKRVGNPIAINPTMELVKLIKADEYLKEKCKIIIERKDVIYEVDASVNLVE